MFLFCSVHLNFQSHSFSSLFNNVFYECFLIFAVITKYVGFFAKWIDVSLYWWIIRILVHIFLITCVLKVCIHSWCDVAVLTNSMWLKWSLFQYLLQTKLKEKVAANLVAKERQKTAQLLRAGSLKDDKYDYQEQAEITSSVSTPSNSYWESPFNQDSLGETAIHLDKVSWST